MGVAQNLRARVTQGWVFVSIYLDSQMQGRRIGMIPMRGGPA